MRAAAILAALTLAISACARDAVDAQVEQRGDGAYALVYSGLYGKARLDLGPTEASRSRDWTVETAGVVLKTENGRDALLPANGAETLPPAVAIRVAAQPLSGAEQTVTRLGASGGVVATRLIQPYTNEKPTGRLSLTAPKGAVAAAQGASAPSFADWKSRKGAGGLVYVGPAFVKAGEGAALVFDSATPQWVQKEAGDLVAKLEPALEKAAGRKLSGAFDIFVGVAEGDPETAASLGYVAAQRPAQIIIELKGAGWRDAAPDAAEVLWRALSSESAKQWLADLKAPPPAWLAEGAADALADEALLAAKIWSPDDAARALAGAHAACAALLQDRPLKEVARDGASARPCGHAFARAGAGAKGAAAFWRAFDKAAKKSEKPGVDQFLLTAAKHAGAHDAALMRTLMKSSGPEAADALEALRRDELR